MSTFIGASNIAIERQMLLYQQVGRYNTCRHVRDGEFQRCHTAVDNRQYQSTAVDSPVSAAVLPVLLVLLSPHVQIFPWSREPIFLVL